MRTKWVTDKMSCFVARKHQKMLPEPRPTSGGNNIAEYSKNIAQKYPDNKNPMGSPLVIQATENGTKHLPT